MTRAFTLSLQHASEDTEQASLFDWLRIKRYRGQPLITWAFAVPNGGSRHPAEAAKFKRCGVKAGVPDVMLVLPAGAYHGLFLELKAYGGRLSDVQREFHAVLREAGYQVETCYGWVEASEVIENYLAAAP